MNETVSYDVFDTIVTRSFAHPRDLFVRLGTCLKERSICSVQPMEFARTRWAAELRARKLSSLTEVKLDEIYQVLTQLMGWDDDTARAVQTLELELESRHLHGIVRMRPELNAARIRVGRLIFLSDMYLPTEVLRPWLEREKVCASEDLLMVSGDARANKSSGRLFAVAKDQTGGSFAHWQHTGDHPFADVEKPRHLGITATHFAAAHLTTRERMARGSEGEFAETWRSLLAGAMRLARLDRLPTSIRDEALWKTGTNVVGPLFYGFVKWVLAEARKRQLKRLFFLARDGQIFLRVAQEIQTALPDPVECVYLHASRLVFSGPAELTTAENMRWLAAPTGHFHSLRQALLQLGLDETWAQQELPERFAPLELDTNLTPDVRQELADWLLAPERLASVRQAVVRRATQARCYLDQVGVRAGEKIGLVDTGWLGSIHRNIERIIGNDGMAVPITGFYLGLMPPQEPRAVGEQIGYTNTFAPLPLVREESHKVMLELLAQSDHGQVIGYKSESGGFSPIHMDPGPVNLGEIRLMQEAILTFTRRMLTMTDEVAPTDAHFARTVIGLYRDLHDRPTTLEAEIFGDLPHSDQLYEQRHAALCQPMRVWAAIAAIMDYRRRPPHWWIQGQATLGLPLLFHTFRLLKTYWWRLRGRTE